MIKVDHTTTECPECHANWQAEEIPVALREWFGGASHYSRLIAVYDRATDKTVTYVCPDCDARWAR